jgi:hypothetical protein
MKHQLGTLQRVQNTAVRIISGKKWRDHITPVLRELHWLPVEERVCYKILIAPYDESFIIHVCNNNLASIPAEYGGCNQALDAVTYQALFPG